MEKLRELHYKSKHINEGYYVLQYDGDCVLVQHTADAIRFALSNLQENEKSYVNVKAFLSTALDNAKQEEILAQNRGSLSPFENLQVLKEMIASRREKVNKIKTGGYMQNTIIVRSNSSPFALTGLRFATPNESSMKSKVVNFDKLSKESNGDAVSMNEDTFTEFDMWFVRITINTWQESETSDDDSDNSQFVSITTPPKIVAHEFLALGGWVEKTISDENGKKVSTNTHYNLLKPVSMPPKNDSLGSLYSPSGIFFASPGFKKHLETL